MAPGVSDSESMCLCLIGRRRFTGRVPPSCCWLTERQAMESPSQPCVKHTQRNSQCSWMGPFSETKGVFLHPWRDSVVRMMPHSWHLFDVHGNTHTRARARTHRHLTAVWLVMISSTLTPLLRQQTCQRFLFVPWQLFRCADSRQSSLHVLGTFTSVKPSDKKITLKKEFDKLLPKAFRLVGCQTYSFFPQGWFSLKTGRRALLPLKCFNYII